MQVLTINGGSSSIKFALFESGQPPVRLLSGKIDRIGLPDATLSAVRTSQDRKSYSLSTSSRADAVRELASWLQKEVGLEQIAAIGHRIVHGGPRYFEPQRITSELIEDLRRISPFDPEHLPFEIELIEAFSRDHPRLPQIACFDTAFHRDLPRVARILPIPRRLEAKGVRRYGFHGLSYAYLLEELTRAVGQEAAQGRIVLAHLGNGASLAAVRDGKCQDTSMAFTPTAGVPMSTRAGDLDPGLVRYLAHAEKMTPEQFHEMVNSQSGLLGVSETSADMRDLLARKDTDVRAAEAIDLFCYQIKKWVGGFAAALGGLDILVFSGGIGENVPEVRARVCHGLEFLGITLDTSRNATNAPVISADTSQASVRVIKTDEELTIAKAVLRLIAAKG
jgi:acetate kinase